jgi:drug/metabolite transporter (DMT)-like permease
VLIEWLWLGTRLNLAELICVAVILLGVGTALAPDDHMKIARRDWTFGIIAAVCGSLCGAVGSVVIRRGYAALAAAHLSVDAGTTGYQRMLGGFLPPALMLLWLKWRALRSQDPMSSPENPQAAWREKWRRVWLWVLANALAGQTLGVTCMQWALKNNPAGDVQAVIATCPILLLPMTRIVDGEKISTRSVVGAVGAVVGVVGLIKCRL